MIIELNKKYDQYENRFYLLQNIIFEDENDDLQNLINRKFGEEELDRIFKKEFRTQGNLYKVINEKFLALEYNPGANDFCPYDPGFARFIRDMDKRDLTLLTQIYSDLIIDEIDHINKMFREENKERVSISIAKDKNPVQLEKLNFSNDSMIIVGDQCYNIELTQIDKIHSIKDIEKNIYDKITEDYQKQLKSIRRNYERRIEKLKSKFDKEKNILFAEILENSKSILENWEFEQDDDYLYLRYKHRITTKKVILGNIMYDYPSEYEELYVEGLKVRVKPFINDEDIRATMSHHLHFNDENSGACTGDLRGKSLITVLKELPKTLEIANMNSPNNEDIENHLTNLLDNDKFRKENRSSSKWTI